METEITKKSLLAYFQTRCKDTALIFPTQRNKEVKIYLPTNLKNNYSLLNGKEVYLQWVSKSQFCISVPILRFGCVYQNYRLTLRNMPKEFLLRLRNAVIITFN